MAIVPCNIHPQDTQDGVDNAALYVHVLDCLTHVLFKRSSKGRMGSTRNSILEMKNDAANILMSLPETGVAPAASAGVTPAGTHIEEID